MTDRLLRMGLLRMGWLFAGALSLPGCHRAASPKQAVYFGSTPVFALTDSTRELLPDDASTAFYQSRFNFNPQVNQPLHRIVSGSNTDRIYLGLVLPPLPTDVAVLTESDSIWQLQAYRALPHGAVLAWLRSRRQAEWNVRYLGASASSKNTHVINLLTTDSAAAHRFYLADKLFEGRLLL